MSCTDSLTLNQQGQHQTSVSHITDEKEETRSPAEMSIMRRQP